MSAEQLSEKVLARESSRSSVYSTPWLVAISVAIFWTALILIVHRNSPRTLISFHGLLHAAIAGEFLQGVTLTPENPFYAGQTLPYYWVFHCLAAQLTRFFGFNIFHSFELLILLWTAGMMITAVFLGRRLYRSTAAGVLIGYLIMAGSNPFGWLLFLRTLLRRGSEIFADNPNYLWGIVHPVFGLIRYNDVGGLYGPLVNFFFNITSRPMALASLLMMVFCLQSVIRRPQLLNVVLLTLSSAMTTALSPIIGITCAAALTLSMAIWWLWQFRQSKLRPAAAKPLTREFVCSIICVLVGLILASPTFYHLLLGPTANRTTFWLFSAEGLRHLLTVVLTASVLFFLSLRGMFLSTDENRALLAIPFLGGLVMLVLNICFELQAGNGSNLFHAGVVLLAVPAAGSIVRNSSASTVGIRKWVLAGIFLVFLPTLCLVVASYTSRPALSVSFQSPVIERSPENSDLAVMYDWIRNETDSRAVFVIDPRDPFAVCGNTAELPAMTQRAIFTESRRHYISAPYPDSKLRFDIAVRTVSGDELTKDDVAYYSALKRPIFVASYDESSIERVDRMQKRYGQPKFARGDLAIYQMALPSQ